MTAETIVGHADDHSAGSHGARAPYTPNGLLRALDGWLAESGHGEDHPWRMSIAQTLQHCGSAIAGPLAELQNAAYDAAAVAKGLDAHIGIFCIEGSATEDDLIAFARVARVVADMSTKLGDCLGDLSPEVAHV